MYEKLIKRINELLDEKGLTVSQLSTLTGLGWRTVKKFREGSDRNWNAATIRKMVNASEISAEEMETLLE